MRRKVNLVGRNTLTVSLPTAWCKKHGVKKGDEIEILDKDGSIIISSKPHPSSQKLSFIIPSQSLFMERLIHTPYRFGIDELEIECKERETIDKIQKTLEKLIGFEITRQGENIITISHVAEGIDEEFSTMLKRAFFMLQEMIERLLTIVSKRNWDNIHLIVESEKIHNKLTNLLEREINKGAIPNPQKSHYIYALVWSLEDICDEIREIAMGLEKNHDGSCKSQLENFFEIYKQFFSCFIKPEDKTLLNLKRMINTFIDEGNQGLLTGSCRNPIISYSLINLCKRLYHLNLSFKVMQYEALT